MTGPSTIPIVIDTDNALGSPRRSIEKFFGGDIDDAFAIAFLLSNSKLISAIYSVAGNADSEVCHFNNCELVKLFQSSIPCIEGLGNSNLIKPQLPGSGCDYLALGPLTNLAYFLKNDFLPKQIWMTLGCIQTLGKWPPLWPVEFNATQDLPAFQEVISNRIKKTIVPLDIAIQLQFSPEKKIELCKSKVGRYLWENSQRWSRRNVILKGCRNFPVWDLVSAVASCYPETCRIEKGFGYLFSNGLFLCDVNDMPKTYHDRKRAVQRVKISIVTAIDAAKIWAIFFNSLNNSIVKSPLTGQLTTNLS